MTFSFKNISFYDSLYVKFDISHALWPMLAAAWALTNNHSAPSGAIVSFPETLRAP